MEANPNPLLKKPLVIGGLANTHKVKISTLKTTKCGKIMKLKPPSKYLPMLTKNASTIQLYDHCQQCEVTISCCVLK